MASTFKKKRKDSLDSQASSLYSSRGSTDHTDINSSFEMNSITSPMSSRPTSGRPTSARPTSSRPKSGHRQSRRQPYHNQDAASYGDQLKYPAVSRPSSASSLSKFPVLPGIGQSHTRSTILNSEKDIVGSVTNGIGNFSIGKHSQPRNIKKHEVHIEQNSPALSDACHKTSTNASSLNESSDNTIENAFPPLKRKIQLPPEPVNTDGCLLLAVKLPNGKRVQRHFQAIGTLVDVVRFAEYHSGLDLSMCEVICDTPRTVFKHLNTRLCDTHLENKTMLHLQLPDEL